MWSEGPRDAPGHWKVSIDMRTLKDAVFNRGKEPSGKAANCQESQTNKKPLAQPLGAKTGLPPQAAAADRSLDIHKTNRENYPPSAKYGIVKDSLVLRSNGGYSCNARRSATQSRARSGRFPIKRPPALLGKA